MSLTQSLILKKRGFSCKLIVRDYRDKGSKFLINSTGFLISEPET